MRKNQRNRKYLVRRDLRLKKLDGINWDEIPKDWVVEAAEFIDHYLENLRNTLGSRYGDKFRLEWHNENSSVHTQERQALRQLSLQKTSGEGLDHLPPL